MSNLNIQTTLHSAAVVHFSEKLFWVIEAINEASASDSFMNLSHKLFAIDDAKALCSILSSSGNIPVNPPSYIKLAKTLVSRGLEKYIKLHHYIF